MRLRARRIAGPDYRQAEFRQVRWFSRRPSSPYRTPSDLAGNCCRSQLVRATRNYFATAASMSMSSSRGAQPRSNRPCWRTRSSKPPRPGRHQGQPAAHPRNDHRVEHAADRQPARDERRGWKRTKIENIALLLKAAIEAQDALADAQRAAESRQDPQRGCRRCSVRPCRR